MKTLSIRNVLAVLIVGALLGTAYFTNSGLLKAPVVKASASQNVSGYAWSENIGWISFNSTSDGSAFSYGVNISPMTGVGIFSGKAWSENIGWISFDSSDLTGCPSGTCNAQVDWSTGKVTGWARALSAVGSGSGWDGWIKLSDDSVGVWNGKGVTINLTNGKFSGYAWGGGDSAGVAGVVGWIDFAPTVGGNPIPNPAQVSSLPCTDATATWGACTSSATCTTPPSPAQLTGQPGIKSGFCPDLTATSTTCSTAIVTCTAPTPAQTKTHFWQF